MSCIRLPCLIVRVLVLLAGSCFHFYISELQDQGDGVVVKASKYDLAGKPPSNLPSNVQLTAGWIEDTLPVL